MGDVFLGLRLRSSDILIAIMEMAGPGKSTLILLCTGQDVPVGHDLQACTQHVTAYQCKSSDTSDIYLLDTPGFDDTNRSDTEVLKEIALCLTKTYEDNIKLSGILYLHRITDRRMGESAKKNLMMFRKLCGEESLMNVILVTTMWEDEYAAIGERREQELIATGGFWGALVEEGAQINRHYNTRSSAMPLLRTIAKSDRVTISIQKEMVSEHKDLNKTEAGIGLNSDILLAELRVMKEMSEALEMERQARKDQDERSAEEQRQYQETMQKRFDHLNQERDNLKVGLEEMKEQIRRFKVLEGKYRENQERMRQQDKIESLEEQHKLREQEMLQRTEEASRELKSLRLQLSERGNARMGISSMRPRSSGSHYVTGSKDLVLFLSGRGFFLEAEAEISSWSGSFATKYPELAAWLDKHQKFGCPRHISLGAGGYFYIAMMDNSVHWRIPKSVSKRITGYIGERTVRPIQRLWLGYNHDYVAEISDDDYLCNIENYDNLEGLMGDIDSEGASIMLAMNIEDPRGYILVQELGEAFRKIGTAGNQFDEARWQRFRNDN
ncbi:hypothetical protein BFJ66_g15538, partial [Fusarium oxysporum f. sp. cepae]